jgi:outer membrane immunogenic protein
MKRALIASTTLSLLTVSALAADIGVRPASFSPPGPPPFTWTSCYGGLRAGGGWGTKDLTDTAGVVSPFTGFTSANLSISGYTVGGQVGCDYQATPNWVLGIEGSVSGGSITGTTKATQTVPGAIPGDNANFKATTDFLMSATARVGYAVDRWMFYGKGGVAGAGDNYSITGVFGGLPYDFEGVENRIGWTAGAGIEWAAWEELSVRLEYDYYGFGTRGVTFIDNTFNGGASGPVSIKQNIQVVTVGVNFHVYPGQW